MRFARLTVREPRRPTTLVVWDHYDMSVHYAVHGRLYAAGARGSVSPGSSGRILSLVPMDMRSLFRRTYQLNKRKTR